MAEANTQPKIDAAAEQVQASAGAAKEAGAAAKPAPAKKAPVKPAAKRAPVKKAAALKATTAKKAVAKASAPQGAAKKTTAKKAPAKKAPAKASSTAKTNPVTKLKDTIMATAQNTDLTAQAKEMASDMQDRLKMAYAKTGELAGDVNEFNKANVDAIVESGKIFFAGAQELAKDNVETGKTVVETVTADAKKMAAVKSPTELMQLQGELARRNFDALVSYGSQRTEAWVKLYNDAFAPISNRVSVAAEKITKAA